MRNQTSLLHTANAPAETSVDKIGDYRLVEELHRGIETRICRARRANEAGSYIVKITLPSAGKAALARLRDEQKILQHISGDRVVRCVAFEPDGNGAMLVLEDINGRPLQRILAERRLSLIEALRYASKIAEGLVQIHGAQVIHKDINPGNVIVNEETGELRIIDFSISTMLTREQQSIVGPDCLVGTLAYMSPEQTGRMNRVIDYRSDFYSFGAMLYEMLTGSVPFMAKDPLDLVHLHIAKLPTSPSAIDPSIPRVVSDVALKLLAKMAEDRYQGAWGIKFDLEECLRQLEANGTIVPFPVAQHDRPQQFRIPQRLYGREKKVEALLDKFTHVVEGGREIVLIGGHSGIGKTSLVREVYKPITERHGYFIAGKFSQFQRNVPFKALADAFHDLLKQVLTESEEELADWSKQLHEALGSNGGIVAEVLPEIELIMGPQPKAPPLGPAETQARANLTFGNFLQAFCRPGRGLVLFLDDLQWADSASLAFLMHVLKDSSIRNLMIIGAYRNNEMDPAHPLMVQCQDMRKAGDAVEMLILDPIRIGDAKRLLCDAFGCDAEEAQPLAELVLNKTAGNPFFIEEFLKSLYTEGLLSFDTKRGRWDWSLGRIQAQRITDNVVDLLTKKMERLTPATRRVLSLAACLGNRFDLFSLTAIYQHSIVDTIQALRPALEAGLVDPLDTVSHWFIDGSTVDENDAMGIVCRFSHDRVQQAAYTLTPAEERPMLHKSIGELLLANATSEDLDEKLFDIVTHLTHGAELIWDEQQKRTLAELALRAAEAARQAGASDIAFGFLSKVIVLLPERYWKSEYDLMFRLHVTASDAAYRCGKYVEMDALIGTAVAHAKNALDRATIYITKAMAEIRQGRFAQAVATGIKALDGIGYRLPANPSALQVWFESVRLRLALFGKSDSELLGRSRMPDRRADLERRLSLVVGDATHEAANPRLMAFNIYRWMRSMLKQGVHISGSRMASYGMLLVRRGDVDAAYRCSEIALRKTSDPMFKTERVRALNICFQVVRHWKKPVRDSLPGLMEAYQCGMESGEMYPTASGLLAYCYMSFHSGKSLSVLDEEITKYNEIIRQKLQQMNTYMTGALYLRTIRNLSGKEKDIVDLTFQTRTEEEMLRQLEAIKHGAALHTYYYLKSYLLYLTGRYKEAVTFADSAIRYLPFIAGTFTIPVSIFYNCLARLAVCTSADAATRRKLLSDVEPHFKQMRVWAAHAPANHHHKMLLLEAELERVRGHKNEATDLYDAAIEAARQNQFVQEEALANELAGMFHLARGANAIAGTYIREAVECYEKWGAAAKVKELRRTFPQFVLAAKESRSFDVTLNATITGGISSSLFDLRTIVKALKGIAEEKAHSQLLQKTISTAMEFAGADTGVLILRGAGDAFFIEAEVSLEDKNPRILQSVPVDETCGLPVAILNYVKRTRQNVVINDLQQPEDSVAGLVREVHQKTHDVKSLLCLPLVVEGGGDAEGLIGMLYLENRQMTNAFDERRMEMLSIICLAATGRLELSRKAMMDGLTGLYNHDTFQTLLSKEFSAASRSQRKLSLVMVDIDHFKRFNDQWGHQVGDAVLRKVASVLKNSCRQSDIVARYGGEEMAVILPDTDQMYAAMVAERMRSSVESCELMHNGTPLKVTASLGVCTATPEMRETSTLIKKADEALYVSKREGRNRVTTI